MLAPIDPASVGMRREKVHLEKQNLCWLFITFCFFFKERHVKVYLLCSYSVSK